MRTAGRGKVQLTALPPGHVALWQRHFTRGELAECETLARRWIGQYRRIGKPHQLLGATLLAQRRFGDALAALREASRLAPADWSIWDNLALALQRHGDFAAAARAFERALRLAPRVASVWSNASANALDRGDAAAALDLAREAQRLDPRLALAHLHAGNALSALGRGAEAEAAFHAALALDPQLAQAQLSLGRELAQRGAFADAAAAARSALRIEPGYAEAHVNLASALNQLGETGAAAAHYRQALALRPDMDAAHSGLLYCLLHDGAASPDAVAAEHRAFGERLEARTAPPAPHANARDPQRPLRLGFVSADLRDHPVARFLEPVWRTLDRAAFELHAYDMRPAHDAAALRLRALAQRWTEAGALSDAQLDARIRADGIDVLFDLSGHTAGNRLALFARKPAPVQVSWIGYPGTTGLRAIDYRLVDAVVAPPGRFDAQFSERLAYLPFMTIFEKPHGLPDVAPLPALGAGRMTFGSFNRVGKLGERTLALWARVLQRVRQARLLIGALPDAAAEDGLRERFARHGVAAERLAFRPRLDLAGYLDLHAEVDVLLDTLPFSSGTTANFALWMGVPTLTLAGDSIAQRLGAVRMTAAGLAEFVAESEDDYVARAAAWAADVDALARLRDGLRERVRARAATQPQQLADALQRQLRAMWTRWCQGLPAATLP